MLVIMQLVNLENRSYEATSEQGSSTNDEAVCLAVHATGATPRNDLQIKCLRNVPRSFTQPQQERLCDLSGVLNHPDQTIPGQCAKLALGGRPLQSAKFATRVDQLRGASIIQLCAGIQSTGPGKCWAGVPAQLQQQMLVASVASNVELSEEAEIAATPLVRVCQHAQDDRPAQCFHLWLEMSKSLSKRDAHDLLDTAIALCKSFAGQVSALKKCMKQTTPRLRPGSGSELGVIQLCQHIGDGKNLHSIAECAALLGRKSVLPSIIAQICARASAVIHPHTCFLAAQQKLRWMDHIAQVSLCTDAAAHTAIVPIDCALAMNAAKLHQPVNSSGPLAAQFGIFVAKLCRRASNSTTVIECVRSVPIHVFTADQVLRLCAASTMPDNISDTEDVSLSPTICAAQARLILQRAASVSKDDWNDLGMSASAAAVHVCEQATSDAPSKCLADTQYDPALSVKLRMQLCQQAISNSPQRCVLSLRKFIIAQRMDIYDVVMVCHHTESLGPAECVMELFHVTFSVTGKVAAQLCQGAKTFEPARCFIASPSFYDDEMKVSLCNQAEGSAPASCVQSIVTRFANEPSMMVSLCRGAATVAPATCAIEAPFGMDKENVVELCRLAVNTAPAKCAHQVPAALRVSWHQVAEVCAGATSTTPGRCLAHHIRHSRLLFRALDGNQIVMQCRVAVAQPAALGIFQASYKCPELRPMCPLQLVLNVLDQFGNPIIEDYHQAAGPTVVHVSAALTGSPDQHQHLHRGLPTLQGPLYATIANGSAVFPNLVFAAAGEFTLTFRAGEGVTEEVVRVLVHPDHAAEALQVRCDKLFTLFQCSAQSSPSLKRDSKHNVLQNLLLPHELHLSAVSCGQHWLDSIGGLVFSGFSPPKYVKYTLPRPIYEFFMNVDVPRADMSAWELLGLPQGETNRSTIRRRYHKRSLEWHPDKWHTLAALLPPARQQELLAVYTLVTSAYEELTASS